VTSGDRTALGDRMKSYEAIAKTTLPRRTYTLIRCDGRAFHSYLRGCVKPFDFEFMGHMDQVAAALCAEVSGTVFAYVQSDEISLLVCDFESVGTQPWFGGEVQKIVSAAAATATAHLNSLRYGSTGRLGTFDARVFTIADPVEVAHAFIWRQRDAVRNSITMAAQAVLGHRRLHGVNGGQMQEMLWSEHGINWNDYPDGAKRGRVVVRETGEREVTFTHKRTNQEQTVLAMRSWWEPRPAPHFTLAADGFLAGMIPPMPRLNDDRAPGTDLDLVDADAGRVV
jgi:tRNA(His) 5'-end guanylyltransferase